MEAPALLLKPMPAESLSSAQLRLQEHQAMTKPKEPYQARCIDCGRPFYTGSTAGEESPFGARPTTRNTSPSTTDLRSASSASGRRAHHDLHPMPEALQGPMAARRLSALRTLLPRQPQRPGPHRANHQRRNGGGVHTSTVTQLPALTAIRNAFEHIDERAMDNAGYEHPSIFDQIEFVTSGILRYADFSLDLRSQVIPALIASRKFIFDVAIEKGGRAKTVNQPIDFGTYTL